MSISGNDDDMGPWMNNHSSLRPDFIPDFHHNHRYSTVMKPEAKELDLFGGDE
jgi:hypothetical protein